MSDPHQVLFLCTGNSARSILCAATLNHLAKGRFVAYSAGSQPAGHINPFALRELANHGIPAPDARSKSWDEFTEPGAPALDIVITVCDSAAQEACPVFFGDFVKAHWGLPDPSHTVGDDATVMDAFDRTEAVILSRLRALVELPLGDLSHEDIARELRDINERFPADATVGAQA